MNILWNVISISKTKTSQLLFSLSVFIHESFILEPKGRKKKKKKEENKKRKGENATYLLMLSVICLCSFGLQHFLSWRDFLKILRLLPANRVYRWKSCKMFLTLRLPNSIYSKAWVICSSTIPICYKVVTLMIWGELNSKLTRLCACSWWWRWIHVTLK